MVAIGKPVRLDSSFNARNSDPVKLTFTGYARSDLPLRCLSMPSVIKHPGQWAQV